MKAEWTAHENDPDGSKRAKTLFLEAECLGDEHCLASIAMAIKHSGTVFGQATCRRRRD